MRTKSPGTGLPSDLVLKTGTNCEGTGLPSDLVLKTGTNCEGTGLPSDLVLKTGTNCEGTGLPCDLVPNSWLVTRRGPSLRLGPCVKPEDRPQSRRQGSPGHLHKGAKRPRKGWWTLPEANGRATDSATGIHRPALHTRQNESSHSVSKEI